MILAELLPILIADKNKYAVKEFTNFVVRYISFFDDCFHIYDSSPKGYTFTNEKNIECNLSLDG